MQQIQATHALLTLFENNSRVQHLPVFNFIVGSLKYKPQGTNAVLENDHCSVKFIFMQWKLKYFITY